ncbi:MAG TPA: class III extradiol ring-cleavage dioxygenase [Bacillales bacterium]|nr:class III extradiol ring-cleavage dioxygenase [Bacillales bacterium]
MVPSLFIAHGAPLLAIEDNDYTQFLTQLGKQLPRPKAVVLFSAHWESDVQKVGNVNEYETIHDFGGFPKELYDIRYPAKGHAEIAGEVKALLSENGINAEFDSRRGLDHGAWVVLRMLFPDANVPVVSMSVNPNLTPVEQERIGRALSPLREKDVLIIGSGGTVHNLRAVNMRKDDQTVDAWAKAFDDWLSECLVTGDVDALFNYEKAAPYAEQAVPPYGKEHFVPLFYAIGASHTDRKAQLLHRSYRYGNLSQSVWQFGHGENKHSTLR